MKKVTLYAIKPSGQRLNLGNNRKTIEIIFHNWEKIITDLKQWQIDKIEYRKLSQVQIREQKIKEPSIPFSRIGVEQYNIIKKELRMEFPITIYLDHAPYNPIHVLKAPKEVLMSGITLYKGSRVTLENGKDIGEIAEDVIVKPNSWEENIIPITNPYKDL